MNELERYVNSYFGITGTQGSNIAHLFKKETFAKGNFYAKQGLRCNKLSFISEGLFRVYMESPEKEVTQWISTPGEFLADLSSIVFKQPAKWNIYALTDATLYTISSEDYHNIHTHIPNWDTLEKLFIAKCFLTLEDRVFSFISMSSEERYKALLDLKPQLINQVPLHFIASMLGMTPETLSRVRKKITS